MGSKETSAPVTFREAQVLDADDIQKLYHALTQDQDVRVQPERIELIAQNPNNYLYVLEQDHLVVGTCFMTLCLDPMYGEQPYAVLENIVISPEARNQGLGTYMLAKIERICFEKDCSKLMLLSSANRVQAHGFFRSIGFSENKKTGFIKYRGDFNVT